MREGGGKHVHLGKLAVGVNGVRADAEHLSAGVLELEIRISKGTRFPRTPGRGRAGVEEEHHRLLPLVVAQRH